eukprot:3936189-Rhodomonas_salina.1
MGTYATSVPDMAYRARREIAVGPGAFFLAPFFDFPPLQYHTRCQYRTSRQTVPFALPVLLKA